MKGTSYNLNFGTILVPVDYSLYSILACRYAAKVAKKANTTMHLFHSFYSPAFDLIEVSGTMHAQGHLRVDVTEKLIESETVDMQNFVDQLYNYSEFSDFERTRINTEVKAGLAKDEILSYAKWIEPEMVIMGSHGADHKQASLLGSITESVIKKLHVPVLAIPENYSFVGEGNLKDIIYLTNFDESDFMSIRKLMNFARLFDMTIHCVHIGSKDENWDTLRMDGLKEYFQKVYKSSNMECHIIEMKTDLIDAIDEYVAENKINIISLTHKKRKVLEEVFKPSLTKKIFYHSETPILVFHS